MNELGEIFKATTKNWLVLAVFVLVFVMANLGYQQFRPSAETAQVKGYYTVTPISFEERVDSEYLALKTTGEMINVVLSWINALDDEHNPRPLKTSYQTFHVTVNLDESEDRDLYFSEFTNVLRAKIVEQSFAKNLAADFMLELDEVKSEPESSKEAEWLILITSALLAGLVWILIKEFVFKK